MVSSTVKRTKRLERSAFTKILLARIFSSWARIDSIETPFKSLAPRSWPDVLPLFEDERVSICSFRLISHNYENNRNPSPDRQGGVGPAHCLNRSLTVAARYLIFMRCGAALDVIGTPLKIPSG